MNTNTDPKLIEGGGFDGEHWLTLEWREGSGSEEGFGQNWTDEPGVCRLGREDRFEQESGETLEADWVGPNPQRCSRPSPLHIKILILFSIFF